MAVQMFTKIICADVSLRLACRSFVSSIKVNIAITCLEVVLNVCNPKTFSFQLIHTSTPQNVDNPSDLVVPEGI